MIIVGFVIAIILLFASLMKMASREGDEMQENEQIKKCKICGKTPSIVDVGGNNPYYEITCCDKTVGSHDRESAEGGWNKMQKGEIDNASIKK